MLNAMTIDLEDWAQGVLDPGLPVSSHVLANTDRVLALLARHRIRATFFALGKVCERFPDLLPTVASAGHEIASHGYGHQLVYDISPEAFEADLRLSMQIIESQIGSRPLGYRAPAFSITQRSLWAGATLAKLGFQYSSSIFPIRKQRYGIPDWPTVPARWPGSQLVEFPLTTLSVMGRRIPVCGGGYMRLLPARVHARAIRQQNQAGQPVVIYLHPYELAPGEVAAFRREGCRFSRKRSFMQALWRSRVEPRLDHLLEQFAFGTMSDSIRAALPITAPARQGSAPVDGFVPDRRLAVPA